MTDGRFDGGADAERLGNGRALLAQLFPELGLGERPAQEEFLRINVAAADAIFEAVGADGFSIVGGVEAVEQAGSRVLRDPEDDRLRREVEQEPAMVACNGVQGGEGAQRFSGPRAVAQPRRREGKTILVARRMYLGAVGDRVVAFPFGG